jgi:pimeloyl-ACP methyl ester carboxylesterase
MGEGTAGNPVGTAAKVASALSLTGDVRHRAGVAARVAGAALGVVAAGAAAGVVVERLTVGRKVRRKARLALDTAGPYGSLRGTPGRAVADDGTALYYEIDEIDETDGTDGTDRIGEETHGAGRGPRRDRGRGGGRGKEHGNPAGHTPSRSPGVSPPLLLRLLGRRCPAPPTVVFCHGYCLNQDSWHFQRAALRGVVRTVHWDQRSHGRSARGPAQAVETTVSIDRLGRDLKAVLDASVPEGPVVLVGHSMGGMTVMALAAHFPEYIQERVVGVALVGTSSGNLGEVNYGLPVAGVNVVRRLLPGVLRAMGSQVELVERGRRATADLFAGLVKRYSFGSREVDPVVARFAERMIESTPVDVVAAFYPAFKEHDKADALAAFRDLPALVLAGEGDLVTPSSHSEAIAELLPNAELVLVPDAGHLVMLEHPGTVTTRLAELLVRAGVDAAAGLADEVEPSAGR